MFRRLGLLAASALYLVPGVLVAARRPLWHDEIFTLYLSQLPTLRAVWAALSEATDLVPPGFYLVTRSVVGLLGEHTLTLRLPAILGSWLMGVCLYRFVARRTSAAYAGLAMIVPLVTLARLYVYEARPSGLVDGFAGLAVLSWQSVAEDERRSVALAILAGALAGAVAVHYYAILLVVPFALAEAVRTKHAGRVDRPVWIAFACAILPLVPMSAQVSRGLPYSHAFWTTLTWGTAIEFYEIALGPAAGVAVAVLVLATLVRLGRPGPPSVRAVEATRLPPHEIALALAFVAMPIVAVALAKISLPVFSPRYVLWAMFGVSALAAWAADALFEHRPVPAVVLGIVIAVLVVRATGRALHEADSERADLDAVATFLQASSDPTRPIVVAQPAEFLEIGLHGPLALADRLVYLTDLDRSIRRTGQDTADRALQSLAHWAPVHVEPFVAYTTTRPGVQVYVREGRAWWMMAEAEDRVVTLRARRGPYLLWDVDFSRGASLATR